MIVSDNPFADHYIDKVKRQQEEAESQTKGWQDKLVFRPEDLSIPEIPLAADLKKASSKAGDEIISRLKHKVYTEFIPALEAAARQGFNSHAMYIKLDVDWKSRHLKNLESRIFAEFLAAGYQVISCKADESNTTSKGTNFYLSVSFNETPTPRGN